MSFPTIPNITPTISLSVGQTVPLLFASIAFEELALAHLLNAEAEKLQLVLGTLTPTNTTFSPATVSLSNLLTVDASVQRTLRDVMKKEMLLEFKFENVLDLLTITSISLIPGSITLLPVTVTACGVPIPISGTLLSTLGTPIAGAEVHFAVTPNTAGTNVTLNLTPPPVTDINGNFMVEGTFTGILFDVSSVTITASATVEGVTVSTSQTITFTCR